MKVSGESNEHMDFTKFCVKPWHALYGVAVMSLATVWFPHFHTEFPIKGGIKRVCDDSAEFRS